MPSQDETFGGDLPGRYSPRLAIRQIRGQQVDGPVDPSKSLIVCTNPRSGSWMLCTALARTGITGYPIEYFIPWDRPDWSRLWGVTDDEAFLGRMLAEGTSPNRVFGMKIMYGHVEELVRTARDVPRWRDLGPARLMRDVFPRPGFVWLRRRDRLKQAVSHARAILTGVWATDGTHRDAQDGAGPECDVELVRRLLDEAAEQDEGWRRLFDEMGQSPLVVWYEDMVADFDHTVRTVLAHAGVAAPGTVPGRSQPRPDVVRQADGVSERWVEICRERLGETEAAWTAI
jgi:LPS sulfotransferase NodH